MDLTSFTKNYPYQSKNLFQENHFQQGVDYLTNNMVTVQSLHPSPPPPPPSMAQNFNYFSNQPSVVMNPFFNLSALEEVSLKQFSMIQSPFGGPFDANNNECLTEFINSYQQSSMNFTPNNKVNALHSFAQQNQGGLWEFSQKNPTQLGDVYNEMDTSVLYETHEQVGSIKGTLVDEIPPLTMAESTNINQKVSNKPGKRVHIQKTNKKTNQIIKGQWSPDEDSALIALVNKHGLKKWSLIAKELNGRVGKQCWMRWHNHLRPEIKKDAWTGAEDIILISAHRQLGNKWVEIARRLPGRTENTVKNHWNATKRRLNTKKFKERPTASISKLQQYIQQVIEIEEIIKKKSVRGKIATSSKGAGYGINMHFEAQSGSNNDKWINSEGCYIPLPPTTSVNE